MPERKPYEPVLSSQAVAFLLGLPKGRQRKLFHLSYQLSENPAQVGDYHCRMTQVGKCSSC